MVTITCKQVYVLKLTTFLFKAMYMLLYSFLCTMWHGKSKCHKLAHW